MKPKRLPKGVTVIDGEYYKGPYRVDERGRHISDFPKFDETTPHYRAIIRAAIERLNNGVVASRLR